MMKSLKNLPGRLVWLPVVLLAGVVGNVLFNLDYWIASLIAGFSVGADGLVVDWEDRLRDDGDA